MPLEAAERQELKNKARKIREEIVLVTESCGGSHLGTALSQTEVLTLLYFKMMKIDPKNPQMEDRDRFVLSKGHGGVGHAVVLAEAGYFPRADLDDFNKTGSRFGMHLDGNKVEGVDASTGSLGHGLGIAVGMAMGARLKGADWWTYCMIGDGESNEGSIWEAAMSAAHHKVTNMTLFLDRNKLMIDGPTEEVMGLEPLAKKWEAFGWNVIEVDGHDFDQIYDGIEASKKEKEKPTVLICNTIKGKGVDFMEDKVQWHYAGLDSAMTQQALEAIRRNN